MKEIFVEMHSNLKFNMLLIVPVIILLSLVFYPLEVNSKNDSVHLGTHAILELKLKLVKQINKDRARYRLKPVKYDSLASEVGDNHCEEMLKNEYSSHWNMKGYKPYHRYSQAGGNDHVTENVSFQQHFDSHPGFHIDVYEMMLKSHRQMLNEKPPNDGHRKNILDPYHTHVGIGLAFDKYNVYMTQEFLDRYVEVDTTFPRKAKLNDKITLTGKVLNSKHTVSSITIFYEPIPKPMSIKRLKSTSAYGLPNERHDLFPVLEDTLYYYEGGGRGDINIFDDGRFKSPIPFFKRLKGIYTVVVWIEDDKGNSIPSTSMSIIITD